MSKLCPKLKMSIYVTFYTRGLDFFDLISMLCLYLEQMRAPGYVISLYSEDTFSPIFCRNRLSTLE